MRFSFDETELEGKSQGTGELMTPPSSNRSPKAEIQWVPLQDHPLFSSTVEIVRESTMPRNLMTWDGSSRLYFWDSNKKFLHRVSIQLGEPDAGLILAAFPSKVLQADIAVSFSVDKISVNRNGSALLLAGSEGLCVMYLYGCASMEENVIICRTVSVGSEIYFAEDNYIRTLQISWHPFSDTHIGILSSDSVFRIFDLSSALEQPEQEYYLQPVEPGSSCKAASICPVDFSFGGDHLWDRFSVFILFSDGSIYILCPIVPFGSVHKWESVLEIYNDANTFGMKSSNLKAINHSNLAISWLEATFPELARQAGEGGNLFAVKAQPYLLFDASISLQGPLRNVYHGLGEDSETERGVCEGRAVSFLYNLVSKDSIIVTAWSGGQLQIDALADEIQPVWKVDSTPRVCVDSYNRILGFAMICESLDSHSSILDFNQPHDHTAWLGHPPPLLRLAIVDLALPKKNDLLISMIADPILRERIYCHHDGGIDAIVLHFLPFTSQASGKEEPMKTPSVNAVLSTPGKSSRSPSLHGFLALSDSFGSSWVVGLTASQECIVLEMETWNFLLTHGTEKSSPLQFGELKEMDAPTIISRELLAGPKAVMLPPSAPHSRSVTADSIEGRATLHQYFKLFHENYVEYAHKVYFELQHHAPHLKKIIDNLHSRLREAQQKLLEVEKKQDKVGSRIERAVEREISLEERLHKLKSLRGLRKKPLSKAEKDFKSELDRFTGVELDALHSSIEALKARLRRHVVQSPQTKFSNQQRQPPKRTPSRVQEDQVSQLKSSLAKLSLLNSENAHKVKLVETALENSDISI